jgi:hypothetical protein
LRERELIPPLSCGDTTGILCVGGGCQFPAVRNTRESPRLGALEGLQVHAQGVKRMDPSVDFR